MGARYLVDAQTGCWVWQGARFRNGYAKLRSAYGHRVFYENQHGKIPAGRVIDHLCRNRACVNPSHLEAVTQRTNSLRGAKTTLPAATVESIRQAIAGGARTREVAERYGVSASHVRSICLGERRIEVGGPLLKALPGQRRPSRATPEVIAEIRSLKAGGHKNVDIARRFGLSPAYTSQLATGALDRG